MWFIFYINVLVFDGWDYLRYFRCVLKKWLNRYLCYYRCGGFYFGYYVLE